MYVCRRYVCVGGVCVCVGGVRRRCAHSGGGHRASGDQALVLIYMQ